MTRSAETGDIQVTHRPPQAPRRRSYRGARVVLALMIREIASRDTRTQLGFAWMLLEPLAAIFVLTIVFTLLGRNPPLGDNFPLFYVTGIIPFMIFAQIGNKISATIRFSKGLLAFPAVTVIDAILARFLVNMIINVLVFVVITTAIIQYYGLTIHFDLKMVLLSFFLMGLFALGIGTFNAILFAAVPTYETVWGLMSRPMLLASGVIHLYEEAAPWAREWLWWNPILHGIGAMRAGFYSSYGASYISPLYTICVSLVLLTAGLMMLRRFARTVLEF